MDWCSSSEDEGKVDGCRTYSRGGSVPFYAALSCRKVFLTLNPNLLLPAAGPWAIQRKFSPLPFLPVTTSRPFLEWMHLF